VEDEIDLREYINVLLRHWRVIVSITLIAVFVAGLVSFLLPHTYEAKAVVLITKARSEIIFEPKYKTSLEEDIASQRKALNALVKSSTVATQVIEQLGDKLKPEERRLENMLDKVQVREQGDLIEISVKSTDPHQATAIANVWVECYERYVNGLYSGILQSPTELQVQADAARKEYEEKQKAWEDFVSSNRVDELSRQIADKELLCDIKSLRERIKAGSSSSASAAANSLALILLETKAFTSLPGELQVSLDQLSGLNVSRDDIDTLISTLEARSGGTPGQSISELRQEILQLRGELEQESAKKRDLKKSRDIAWDTLTTLDSKAAEVRVATLAQDVVVRVAVVAVVPESPVAPRRAMNITIALVLGLVISVFGAFGVEYFQKTGGNQRERRTRSKLG
jgi:capsular polysaccharide biosynthesis protein